MMKQLLTLSLILITTLLINVPQVLAEQSLTGKVKTLLNEGTEEAKIQANILKDKAIEKVKQSVFSRLENFNRTTQKEEVLLNKLKLRIDKAKLAGRDVTELNKLLSDSIVKLEDAKTRLENLEAKKNESLTITSFNQIRIDLKIILQDIQTVKQNSAKIISKLKEFNRNLNTPVKNQSTPSSTRSVKPS